MSDAAPHQSRLVAAERALWVLALLTYGVGDTGTTLAGLDAGRVAEAGPVAAPFVEAYGPLGFLVLKAATLVLFFLVWRVLHTPSRAAVPLALTVVGTVISAWNVVVLANAAGVL